MFLKKQLSSLNRLGNINNPVLNRLGLNIFWYHLWLSPNHFSRFFFQDQLILILIKIYLAYGLDCKKNMFLNRYWFNNFKPTTRRLEYYRWSNFQNKVSGVETSYRFRMKSKLFFQTRSSLLRYNKWLVLFTQWFTPTKPNKLVFQTHKNTHFLNVPTVPLRELHTARFRFFFKTVLTLGLTSNNLYTF